jgi:hypothetical protein
MKRVAATLALALTIAIAVLVLYLGPVSILTGNGGCFLNAIDGPLVVDPKYGTAMAFGDHMVVIAWGSGYTARRDGSEVSVLDPDGNVVATTGKKYRIEGGFQSSYQFNPPLPVDVFFACGSGITSRARPPVRLTTLGSRLTA